VTAACQSVDVFGDVFGELISKLVLPSPQRAAAEPQEVVLHLLLHQGECRWCIKC